MERLQPRYENQNAKATNFARKLLKLALWSFLVCMGVVGLWFTVVWSLPEEIPVEVTVQAEVSPLRPETSDLHGSASIRVSGILTHYTLANEKDVLRGELEVEGSKLSVAVEFAPGEEFGLYTPENQDWQLLISKDGQLLMLRMPGKEDGDMLYRAVGDPAAASQKWQQVSDAHPEWMKLFE